MGCSQWAGTIDVLVDGELSAESARDASEHLRNCPACATAALVVMQRKQSIQVAGRRFAPDAAFRARLLRQIDSKPARPRMWFMPSLAAAALVLAMAAGVLINRDRNLKSEQQLLNEMADLHVGTLASQNPVDVVSTDRHTVKPWFEGKLPFTFNVPELQGSEFSLVGGRVSYLRQSAGAELLFRLRQHQLSLFIFQERAVGALSTDHGTLDGSGLNERVWRHNGLLYCLVGDVSTADLDRLRDLLQAVQ